VLLLRSVGGFTYREVAEVLEVPIGSVMGRLSRARAAVRRRLAELERPTAK
jgi:RNA polymerase sigma-70 factor (ECF subfamily)